MTLISILQQIMSASCGYLKILRDDPIQKTSAYNRWKVIHSKSWELSYDIKRGLLLPDLNAFQRRVPRNLSDCFRKLHSDLLHFTLYDKCLRVPFYLFFCTWMSSLKKEDKPIVIICEWSRKLGNWGKGSLSSKSSSKLKTSNLKPTWLLLYP